MSALLAPLRSVWKAYTSKRLREYGLRSDDVLNVYDRHVEAALVLMSKEGQDMRNRRLKRASDLRLKKEHLPKEMRDYDPFANAELHRLVAFTQYQDVVRASWAPSSAVKAKK